MSCRRTSTEYHPSEKGGFVAFRLPGSIPTFARCLSEDELEARRTQSKVRTSASGRISGGKPFAGGALYLILRNRVYQGEIVHNEESYLGEHAPIIDQPLWDAVQAQFAGNTAQRTDGEKARQPSLLDIAAEALA